ncbi:hypothetical protein [Nostoc sp. TCL26-01]|uniref:hypothetical protein n=1 Tax=Nostoc sp. TCL26-01 TaxID=2576904 RepID=UPI0015C0CE52|nr:hypothetical protein [Nostoc sp. TCL26-01]QLE59777.1 hypothetical protein FD725_30530 [Nostoc sp. TCL26-01]
MNKIKRTTVTVIGAIAISTIGFTNAQAFSIFKDNASLKFFEQWQQQSNPFTQDTSSLAQKLKPLTKFLGRDLQTAITTAIGVLGLPDANEAREEVEDSAAVSDSAINVAERTTNEIDRQITRVEADTTLSKLGQQHTKEQVETTHNSVAQVYTDATAAQDEVVTQNVMKRIAQQNTQTAGILGAMRTDGFKLQQSQNLANLNLTNISRSLDGQKQAHQKQTVDQGFNNLRIAAQARLF